MKRILAALGILGMILPGIIAAQDTGTRKEEGKIMIVYYSRTGNTHKVAEDMASRLGAGTERLIDRKNRKGLLGYIKSGRCFDGPNRSPACEKACIIHGMRPAI